MSICSFIKMEHFFQSFFAFYDIDTFEEYKAPFYEMDCFFFGVF